MKIEILLEYELTNEYKLLKNVFFIVIFCLGKGEKVHRPLRENLYSTYISVLP